MTAGWTCQVCGAPSPPDDAVCVACSPVILPPGTILCTRGKPPTHHDAQVVQAFADYLATAPTQRRGGNTA